MAQATHKPVFQPLLAETSFLTDTTQRLHVGRFTGLDFAHAIMAKHGFVSGGDYPHRSLIFRAFTNWQDEANTVMPTASHKALSVHRQPLANIPSWASVMPSVIRGTNNQVNGGATLPSIRETPLSSVSHSSGIKRTLSSATTAASTAKPPGLLIQRKRLSSNAYGPGLTPARPVVTPAASSMTFLEKASSSSRVAPIDAFNHQSTMTVQSDGPLVEPMRAQVANPSTSSVPENFLAFTPLSFKSSKRETNPGNTSTASIPVRYSVSSPHIHQRIITNFIANRIPTSLGAPPSTLNTLLSPVSSRGLLIQRKRLASNAYGPGLTPARPVVTPAASSMTFLERASSSSRVAPIDAFNHQSTMTVQSDGPLVEPMRAQVANPSTSSVPENFLAFTPLSFKSSKRETNPGNTSTASIPVRYSVSSPHIHQRIITNFIANRIPTSLGAPPSTLNTLLSPVSSRGLLIQRKRLASNAYRASMTPGMTTDTHDRATDVRSSFGRISSPSGTERGRGIERTLSTATTAASRAVVSVEAFSHRRSPPFFPFEIRTPAATRAGTHFEKAIATRNSMPSAEPASITSSNPDSIPDSFRSSRRATGDAATVTTPATSSTPAAFSQGRLVTNGLPNRVSRQAITSLGNRPSTMSPPLSSVASRGLFVQRKRLASNAYGASMTPGMITDTHDRATDVRSSFGRISSPSGTERGRGIERTLSTATSAAATRAGTHFEKAIATRNSMPSAEPASITSSIPASIPDSFRSSRRTTGDASTVTTPATSSTPAAFSQGNLVTNSLPNRVSRQAFSSLGNRPSTMSPPLSPVVSRGLLVQHKPLVSNTTRASVDGTSHYSSSPTSYVAGKSAAVDGWSAGPALYASPSNPSSNLTANANSIIPYVERKPVAKPAKRPGLTLISNEAPQRRTHSAELTLHMPRQDRLLSTEPVLEVFQSQPQAQYDHHPAHLKSDAEMAQHSAMTTHLSTEALADRIFRILERRLVVERERRGIRL